MMYPMIGWTGGLIVPIEDLHGFVDPLLEGLDACVYTGSIFLGTSISPGHQSSQEEAPIVFTGQGPAAVTGTRVHATLEEAWKR